MVHQLRICHLGGILKLPIQSNTTVRDLKLLIREKLKIEEVEKDYISLKSGSTLDPVRWFFVTFLPFETFRKYSVTDK